LVAEKYRKLYEGNPDIPHPAFYGMITNIDENFGRLLAKLDELGIADNTILIFMTDNGSSGGCKMDQNEFLERGYNAGMRGQKGSYYDGGHRVPFFIRWPDGGIQGGRDIDDLALHLDLMPTLIELCELTVPDHLTFDGISLACLLTGLRQGTPERTHFIQYRQSTNPPQKWTNAVITKQWRLIAGEELFDIKADPEQRLNIAEKHPEVVAKLRVKHEAWWDEIHSTLGKYPPISLGNDHENPTRLDAMDVMGDVAWNQTQIVLAHKSTGRWTVDVEQPGEYTFSLRRWPEELALPIDEKVSPKDADSHIYAPGNGESVAIDPTHALIKLYDQEWKQEVKPGAQAVTFSLNLEKTGVTELEAWFLDETGDEHGAYYVYVERLMTRNRY
jgi:hypothetical protein